MIPQKIKLMQQSLWLIHIWHERKNKGARQIFPLCLATNILIRDKKYVACRAENHVIMDNISQCLDVFFLF